MNTLEDPQRPPPSWQDQTKIDNQRDLTVQFIISLGFGLAALLAFCILRPRWTSLYAARKKKVKGASILPDLPDSFLGWIPVVYKITEEQILASAGLDAYVFLSFFRLAIKFTAVAFFLQAVIMLPVHYRHTGDMGLPDPNSGTNATANATSLFLRSKPINSLKTHKFLLESTKSRTKETPPSNTMLWLYVMFVYLFSAYALYLIITHTKKIIHLRQKFLGGQSTVTDKTIRLSGVPEELRAEDKIKETIENLQIGKVDSVLMCRDWSELDELLSKRVWTLRKLEGAWTAYLGPSKAKKNARRRSATGQESRNEEESTQLLDPNTNGENHVEGADNPRPTARLWYGFLNLQSRKVDALDYYEEKLRKIDEEILASRKKVFRPTPLAFVTMDSTASAQMAVQAVMDPEPMILLAKPAPAPSDVVWQNTYLSRYNRMFRAWSITLVIAVLSVFWSILLVPLAGLLTLENIGAVSKPLENLLRNHQTTRALIQTGLPTLVFSLLSVAVPYLYYWLSTLQGMLSQGEVEMSLISKNFFFTFFNLFVVFTVFGTVSNATGYVERYSERIGEIFKDTTKVGDILAKSLKNLVLFYMNLIVLQGIGLFPFRLLEFGSVSLYPFYRIGAKTPRDYAELSHPPEFSYGFYLPQSLLIFIICIVYSVLPASWFVLFFGLVYFLIGGFIYKYQLLYAMTHSQHSTGKAWPIICKRIVLGLVVFQIAMAGILGLSLAWKRALLILPLLVFSIWFTVYYQRSYEPLMKFIAIRSLTFDPPFGDVHPPESRYEAETAGGRTVDEGEESGLRYMNPSLVIPLEDVWLPKKTSQEANVNPQNENEGAEEVV